MERMLTQCACMHGQDRFGLGMISSLLISAPQCLSGLPTLLIDSSSSLSGAAEVISKVAFQAWIIWKGRNDLVFNHVKTEDHTECLWNLKECS